MRDTLLLQSFGGDSKLEPGSALQRQAARQVRAQPRRVCVYFCHRLVSCIQVADAARWQQVNFGAADISIQADSVDVHRAYALIARHFQQLGAQGSVDIALDALDTDMPRRLLGKFMQRHLSPPVLLRGGGL